MSQKQWVIVFFYVRLHKQWIVRDVIFQQQPLHLLLLVV